jgi:hypothetical protein
MLVLLSNLHLTDGSCGDHSASDRLTGALNELQYVLKHSQDKNNRLGSINRISSNESRKKIDVVLLGDTFDFTSSRKWHDHDIRPWNDSQHSKVANIVEMIFEDVTQRYSHGFSILNRLLEDGIDVGTSQKSLRRVPLQLHYMVGDTDRMLHHFGPAYDTIRARVCALMQLSNMHDAPFPHEPIESETILSLFGEYGIFARHGDLQDPWSCEGDRRASSVNELMQIELVQPFVQSVLQSYCDGLADEAREHLIGMIHSQHVSEIRAKLLAVSNDSPDNSKVANRVLESWHNRLDQFLRHKKLQNRIAWQPLDLVSELRRRLTIEHSSQSKSAVEPRSWFDRRVENENHSAWIAKPFASRTDQRKAEYYVTAHYSQDVVIELIERQSQVDLVPLRRVA